MQSKLLTALTAASLLFAGAAIAQSSPAAGPSKEAGREHKPEHKPGQHFQKLDKNNDGSLDRKEAAGHERLVKHFDEIDANKDGKVSKEEMHAHHAASREKHKEKFEEKFKGADKSGDGALTKAEVESGKMPHIAKNFDQIDANKDGKVTQEELKAFMKNHRKQREPAK